MENRFNEKARAMDADARIREMAVCFADAMAERLPLGPEMRVLDYGCGSGLVAEQLHGKVGSLCLMDSAEEMLVLAQEKAKKMQLSHMDFVLVHDEKRLSLAGPFDLIYLHKVLHHIKYPEEFLTALLAELKSGGYLCIGDLAPEPGTFHDDNAGVFHFGFDPEELRAMFIRLGLSTVQSGEYMVVNKRDRAGVERGYSMLFFAGSKP